MTPRLPRFAPLEAWDPAFLEGTPELETVEAAASRFRDLADFPDVPEIDRRLRGLAPVRFEEQPPKKKRKRRRRAPVGVESLYDGRIVLEGVVPTRARSWHDLMNALVWASFPEAKRALHARQFEAARARLGGPCLRLPGRRTAEEDELTMLDEGGEVVLAASASVVEGLVVRDESLDDAIARGDAARYVFGHALLEHAIAGCRAARPKRLHLVAGGPLPADPDARRALCDARLAEHLRAGGC